MKSYFAYTRVSTAKQGERGSSLQEQRSAIEVYASRHGLTINAWFEEMETAAKFGRRMFTRMLADLENGRAQGLIIHKIDRSARNLKDWAHLADLMDRGIEVHFAHESLDMNTRGGRLSADIQAVVAADYIRNLRDEVRKGFYGRLKQGIYPLKAPIGYLDRGKARLKEPDPAKASLVRQMFELYASGRYSLDLLRTEMHRRGLAGATGRPLSKNGTVCALRNPFYVGLIRIKRTGETFEGKHEAIVSKIVFDRVQAVLDGRAYASPVKHGFAYRRLIRCAACGYSLIGERQKGHVYYRCHSVGCRGTSLREAQIEEAFRCAMSLIAFNDEELRDLRDIAGEAKAAEVLGAEERQAQIKRSLGLCEDRLTRLTDAFLDTSIDKDMFEERNAKLLAERARLREALEHPERTQSVDQLLLNLELGHTAQLRLNSPFPEEKRETIQLITSNFVVQGKDLVIALQFPFDEIVKRRGVPCCALAHVGPRKGVTLSQLAKPAPAGRLKRADIEALITALRNGSDEQDQHPSP